MGGGGCRPMNSTTNSTASQETGSKQIRKQSTPTKAILLPVQVNFLLLSMVVCKSFYHPGGA